MPPSLHICGSSHVQRRRQCAPVDSLGRRGRRWAGAGGRGLRLAPPSPGWEHRWADPEVGGQDQERELHSRQGRRQARRRVARSGIYQGKLQVCGPCQTRPRRGEGPCPDPTAQRGGCLSSGACGHPDFTGSSLWHRTVWVALTEAEPGGKGRVKSFCPLSWSDHQTRGREGREKEGGERRGEKGGREV